jgi:hypothetical protein
MKTNDTNNHDPHTRPIHSLPQVEKIKEAEEFQYQSSLTKQKLQDEQNIHSELPASIPIDNNRRTDNPSC